MNNIKKSPEYDLRNAISNNRLVGLWRMMSGFRIYYFAAIICLSISALAKTGTYLLLEQYIDRVLGKPDAISILPFISLSFIGLAFVEGSFAFLTGRLASRSSEGITLRLRNFLFDHIQRLTFSYHSKTSTGELIQRSTSDVDAIRRFFADQAIGVGRIFILFTINFIALLRINVTLAFISITSVPIIVLISIFFFKRISNAYERFQEQEAVLSTTLQENLSGVRVVKAFSRQNYEKSKFDIDNKEKLNRGIRLLLMHSLFWPASDVICGIQMLTGYLVGALMAINGTITIGSYLAYLGLIVWLIWPMRNLGRLIVQTSTGMVSYNRVMDVIRQQEEDLGDKEFIPKNNLRGSFNFSNVSFEYDEDNPVLENITFDCKQGQVVAILGATGSGKTTLVNLLPRFYDYTDGKLTLDGVDIKEYPRSYLRRHIGIVEQEPFLFSRTIKENITYGMEEEIPQDGIENAARAAAIHDVILSFPEGYETMVGERGVTLSGGQKQRLAIARTILKSPRILILDDSTSSVDTETEGDIRTALENLMKGRTTFIIAHRIQSVMNADLIIVMDSGKIVQRGTHAELVTQEGVYKKIFDIQTKIEFELEKEISTHA